MQSRISQEDDRSEEGTVAGSYEHANETSCSIKGVVFLD
jgi:hypothetical protein